MVDQMQIPHSVVEGKVPLPHELEIAGLAVNLKDFTLFTKGYDGLIIRLTGVAGDDNSIDAVVYPMWSKPGGGSRQYTSSGKLSFNPSTGELSAVSFRGSAAALTGLTSGQVQVALGFLPIRPRGDELPPPASDLASVISLANGIRQLLISSGIGS